MKKTVSLALIGAAALAAGGAAAGSGGPQDGLLIDRDRPDRRPATTQSGAPAPSPGQPETQTVAPFVLRAVSVDGSRLTAEAIEAAVQPFIGQTLDAQGLARLQQALSSAYAGSDYALPIIVLDTRQTNLGVVRALALEGRIGRVHISGDTDGNIDLLRHYSAALIAEAPLSRARAERYFSLIADIPGAQVTTRAAQGANSNLVDLELELKKTRWDIAFGLDNRGSSLLGRTQMTGSVTLNGGFRLGDQTRLSLIVPTDIDRFQYVTLAHRQPVGHDGAAISGSLGHLRTRPPGGVQGEATTAGLVFSWPMIRSYETNLVLSAGLDGVNSDSAVFGELIASERTRVARAAAAWSRAQPRMTTSASLSFSQGIDGLGASTRGGPAGLTDLDFTKVTVRGDMARAVGRSVRLTAAASAQFSNDATPATEQFALGGPEFGRGFSSALLTGDSGWGVRAEAAWRPQALRGAVQGSEIYAFGDGGETTLNARPGLLPRTRRDLASVGAGARVALGRKTVVELEAAKAVSDPRPSGDDWRVNVGLSTRF